MTFEDFKTRLIHEYGASIADVYRLDRKGRQSADDAHRKLWESGALGEDGVHTFNDYQSFCACVGRQFVLDNIEIFFEI